MKKINVLFVCMGNICRSPTAQGVFEQHVQNSQYSSHIWTDSAGTHAYHVGESPDRRSQSAARARGINLSLQRARKVNKADFDHFDYVIAMDHSNYNDLIQMANPEQQEKVYRLMEFSSRWQVEEVPDPYYGGTHGFERVLDMVESASEGLLMHILVNDFSAAST